MLYLSVLFSIILLYFFYKISNAFYIFSSILLATRTIVFFHFSHLPVNSHVYFHETPDMLGRRTGGCLPSKELNDIKCGRCWRKDFQEGGKKTEKKRRNTRSEASVLNDVFEDPVRSSLRSRICKKPTGYHEDMWQWFCAPKT